MNAETITERCALLGGISEEPGRLTRRYGTPAMRLAQDAVASWMRQAGMDVREDAVGNLIGRYQAATPGARALLLGSHLDTVRDAGTFDGPLGVLTALACVERLAADGRRLPFAVEVIAFAEEEGARYAPYLGSSVMAGSFDAALLSRLDDDGAALADAIRAFDGDPDALESARRDPAELIGYCELHIEQGPVLERAGRSLGAVTAIQGQTRVWLTLTGQAGHAGTVPMAIRHDALAAAAQIVVAIEALARATEGLVATVGQLEVSPGASNVIPGQAKLSLDLRHQDDAARDAAFAAIQQLAGQIAGERGVVASWGAARTQAAVPCSAWLSETVRGSIASVTGLPATSLPSGAGHDAAMLARIAPVAMLFVRCAGGISHNPAESVTVSDVADGLAALSGIVEALARG